MIGEIEIQLEFDRSKSRRRRKIDRYIYGAILYCHFKWRSLLLMNCFSIGRSISKISLYKHFSGRKRKRSSTKKNFLY